MTEPQDETGTKPIAIATIGVYGFSGAAFIGRLRQVGVRLLLDVRQRRAVRGAQYAWANARRLQEALALANIGYLHAPQLAPTTALRELQYAEDERQGVGKRSREHLAEAYTRRYTAEILDEADLDPVVKAIGAAGLSALFCVERDAVACHRSLIAERLCARYGATVTHLGPTSIW